MKYPPESHPDFDWNDLRAFLGIVRSGKLTAAARRIGVDHSTLGRRIGRLEAALRVRLFDRSPSGYVLTIAGERLVPQAEAMESLAIGAYGSLADEGLSLGGSVRVGTPEGFGTFFLALHIGELTKRHPELEIELVANPRGFSLSKREADIAISMSQPEEGRLHSRKLADYELGLYAARSYLERSRTIKHVSQLREHQFIGYISDLIWTPELDYLPNVSRELNPRLKISNIITQMTATLGGAGLCILPYFMANREPSLVRLFEHEIKLIRSYWLIVHSDMRDLARVRMVSAFIADVAHKVGRSFWIST